MRERKKIRRKVKSRGRGGEKLSPVTVILFLQIRKPQMLIVLNVR